MKKSTIILFVTLLVWGSGLSWGNCTSGVYCSPPTGSYTCPSECRGDNLDCSSLPPSYQYYCNLPSCKSLGEGAIGITYRNAGSYFVITNAYDGNGTRCWGWSTCGGCGSGWTCTRCDTQCEADSLVCVNDGGIWVDNPNAACGKSCLTQGCTSEDTLKLQREKAHCDSLGATNNFELVNNSDGTCGFLGICNLCSGNAYRNYVQNLKERCCELGKIPDSVKCVMKDITSTQNAYAELQGDGCLSTGYSVNISPTGETYVEGCEPTTNSSNSGGSSSSESGMSSSSESGGDSLGLEWLKDSTHKIIMYDSTTAANSIDLVNYLLDIKTCLEAGTCGGGQPIDYSDSLHAIKDTLHRSNEFLKQIADKDLSVQVNGGLTAEKQAELVNNIQYVADSAAKYGNVNGEKLDSIVSALKGIGMDSIVHKLDSMRNDRLDSISGGIYSLDSTFAYWGDSSNWKVDSAGWGGKYDSLKDWGDSLTGAMGDWLEGCDTTGGKHCDNIYIGSHGLDSATSGMKGAAGALRDSMLNGRFADSLNLWASKFNNPKITGSGSNTCPSALTRSYSLNFGSMGEVQMGSFGTYLCEPIFGSVTPWTLGRILLRAIVAISCMWFLFKCATGFKGDSGEED